MNLRNKLLFERDEPIELGIGFHNIGSGVFRYSHEDVKKTVGEYYSQRCGHLPLNAKTIGILVEKIDDDIRAQVAYLSELYGREIKLLTPDNIKKLQTKPLIVPYIAVPEAEAQFSHIKADIWGLPTKLTHVLKNKSEFHRVVNILKVEDFKVPDYSTTYLAEVIPHTKAFLQKIETLYAEAGFKDSYPLGVMLRAADEDGNFGSSLMYEKGKYVVMIPNGEVSDARVYGNWEEALVNSKRILAAAMQTKKEPRVVVSRYVDTIDSPGMSMVILNGEVFSLGWNIQTKKEPSRNPIAAGTYNPTDPVLRQIKGEYEDYSAKVLEKFLRKTAERCKINFNQIQGIVNIDLIIPSDMEKAFQEKRGQKVLFYFSECNPRWTTYTDAVMTILGAQHKPQTVGNMLQVIKEGIAVVDKYKLPSNVDPKRVRDFIYKKDQELQKKGTRIICRMTTNPMGVIYAGDIELAQAEMRNIVSTLASQNTQASVDYLFQ
jgi:hypothetical protein